MTMPARDLEHLCDRILRADPARRLRHQPELAALIARMEAAGEPVPAAARNLCEELTCAMIEAQFDNMPV